MKKLCCAAALAAFLSGCAALPTKPLASRSALQGKRIAISHYAKADFIAMSPGSMLIGPVAAIAMGTKLVRSENLDDPAIEIGERLANDMAERRSAVLLPVSHDIAISDKPSSLVKSYPGADIILDVKTVSWMYSYYATAWSKYRVNYAARIRLLDGKTGALIAQHVCKIEPTDPNNPPTSDQLHADHAALLKQLFHKAADSCIEDVEHQALVLQE